MTIRQWLLRGCMTALLGAVGCKSTEVMMVNDLGEDAVVTLQGPGQIRPDPPSLPVASTGKGIFKIQTASGDLPANYEWQGGGRIGTIVITDKTPKRQILNLSTGELVSRATIDVKGSRAGGPVEVEVNP